MRHPPLGRSDGQDAPDLGYSTLPQDVIDLLRAVDATAFDTMRVEEIYNNVGRAQQLQALLEIGFNVGTARALVLLMRS